MSYASDTTNKSARHQWTKLNVHGFSEISELRQALVTFDSGDESEAIADCQDWNETAHPSVGLPELDLDDWYGGIEDAIEERAKYE